MFTMKVGDLKPSLVMQVLDDVTISADGTVVGTVVKLKSSLVEKVKFAMRAQNNEKGKPKVYADCAVLDEEEGIISYTWVDGDTDTAAIYNCEIEVIWKTGEPETFPNELFFQIAIKEDLNENEGPEEIEEGEVENTEAPLLSGVAEVGRPLSVTSGIWTGSPEAYGYKWQKSDDGESDWETFDTDIAVSKSASEILDAELVGKYIRVQVEASRGIDSAFSNVLGPVEEE